MLQETGEDSDLEQRLLYSLGGVWIVDADAYDYASCKPETLRA